MITCPDQRDAEGTRWHQPLLHALPTAEQTHALARDLRERVLGAQHWDAGPVDLDLACERAGIELEESPLRGAAGGLTGLLVSRPEGFRILVDPEPEGGWDDVPASRRDELSRHRARFRTGHEWAHTFFFERTTSGVERTIPKSDALEDFCDEFARAVLVPAAAAKAFPPTVDSALALQRRYDVSLEVAVRALAAAHPALKIFLWVFPSQAGEPAFLQWRSPESYVRGLGSFELLKLAAAKSQPGEAARWQAELGGRRLAGRTLRARRQVLAVCR